MIVPDVLEFPGHIACDADSRSVIVVPVLVDGEVGGFFLFHLNSPLLPLFSLF